jgi:hypothetical protein
MVLSRVYPFFIIKKGFRNQGGNTIMCHSFDKHEIRSMLSQLQKDDPVGHYYIKYRYQPSLKIDLYLKEHLNKG